MRSKSITTRSVLLILLAFFSACSGVKRLQEGERYYSGAELTFDQPKNVVKKDELRAEMHSIIPNKPNTKFLGSRPWVWVHHLAGDPKKQKGFKYWLKYKVGQEPVLIDDIDADRTSKLLKSFMLNQGYFSTEVSSERKTRKHSAGIDYQISSGRPYRLDTIVYFSNDSLFQAYDSLINEETTLEKGEIYELEKLQRDQERIEDFLENQGYFFMDDRYLIFRSDSASGDHGVDLDLTINQNTPASAITKYTINEVNIFPDYTLTSDTSAHVGQTEEMHGYRFLNNNHYVREDILADVIRLEKGKLYAKRDEQITRQHLSDLGVYKYVNVKFNPVDSNRLNANIYMSQLPKKSLRLELQGVTKSNNFVGPSATVTFQNRNVFNGAELLELKLNGSYDVQFGGRNDPPLNAFEFLAESSILFPRLIIPVHHNFLDKRFMPSTKVSTKVRVQKRLNLFRLTSFETQYGFIWRQSINKRHEFHPLNVSFVRLSSVSNEFQARLDADVNLSRSLENQFIFGILYDYQLNSKNDEVHKNRYYFNGSVDISGNLLSLVNRVIGTNENENGNYEVLGVPYSQYFKAETDFRYFLNLGPVSELAMRFLVGSAWAYGNAQQVPYIKQFAIGGTNSIRAFRARSVGPGSYSIENSEPQNNQIILDETGDFKLETNLEYRATLAGAMKGAVFLDAGNIWLWNENEQKPGGKFSGDWLSEMAVGTGVGLRFDFNFFVVRFDLAFPLRDPSRAKGDRWTFKEIDLADKNWRSTNLLLNFALGYPF